MRSASSFRLAQDERGAAAVEFALVSGAFITFIFGIIYIAIIAYTDAALHWAVERAVRMAVISTSATEGEIKSEVNSYLTSMGIPSATVSYDVQGAALPVAHISATLAQSYTIPFIPTFKLTYSAEAYVPQGF